MKYLLKPSYVYINYEIIKDCCVAVEDGKISNIGSLPDETGFNVIELDGLTLAPGFIDIHLHGGNGCDTMDAAVSSLRKISEYKISEGVTSFCPATVTAPIEKTKKAVRAVAEAMKNQAGGAKIIGSFLEGPYINPEYKGAHPEEFIREISLDEIKVLVSIGEGSIKSFAVAPEKENASDAIKYLVSQNINVRIGHSAATAEQAAEAVKLGANIAIHTFNAMSPFSHRVSNMTSACLTEDGLYTELICDMIHTSERAANILFRCKGAGKLILITDCMMAGGLDDGDYTLGEMKVRVSGKTARTPDGTLAGSVLRLKDAVRNMAHCGASRADAIRMATANPAMALGIFNETGSIDINKKADLIALDDNYQVKFVMVDGLIKKNFQD